MAPSADDGGHVEMQVAAYLLGGLSAREAAAVRAHLDRCARCRAEHDELAAVPALLALLAPEDLPGDEDRAAGPGDEDGAAGRKDKDGAAGRGDERPPRSG